MVTALISVIWFAVRFCAGYIIGKIRNGNVVQIAGDNSKQIGVQNNYVDDTCFNFGCSYNDDCQCWAPEEKRCKR